jgi:hypothetical protein
MIVSKVILICNTKEYTCKPSKGQESGFLLMALYAYFSQITFMILGLLCPPPPYAVSLTM